MGRGWWEAGTLCAPDLSVHRFLIKRGQASGTCCGLGVYGFFRSTGVRFYFRVCSLIEEVSLYCVSRLGKMCGDSFEFVRSKRVIL